jgi:hypothetical protein
MKMNVFYNACISGSCRLVSQTLVAFIGITWLAPVMSYAQVVTIVSPATNQKYLLPDTATFHTAADIQNAIAATETAGKTLSADAATEEGKVTSVQNELIKAGAAKTDYLTSLNDFSKNDVAPYNADFNNYNAAGTKFNVSLAQYNKAALANNALPAKDRKPVNVAALTKQKVQIDAMAAQLGRWKIKLDAAKAKLDVKNTALQKRQQKYEATEKSAAPKLKASKTILNGLFNQLTICATYAARCHESLASKFKTGLATDNGYFGSPAYKSTIATLYGDLVKLKTY